MKAWEEIDDLDHGVTVPRIYTPPLRPLWPRSEATEAHTLGYQLVDFSDWLGIPLLPWQQWTAVHLLELVDDGQLRWGSGVVLVGRRSGKTRLALVLGLFTLYVLGRKEVIGIAQDLDTAEEVIDEAVALVLEEDEEGELVRPELAEEVEHNSRRAGKRALVLSGRRRWRAKAAGGSAARGSSGDLVIMDEVREQRDWFTWAAVSKVMLTRPNSLMLLISNAGDTRSVVLRTLRERAHAHLGYPDGPIGSGGPPEGEARTCFIEYSAPPEVDVQDVEGWRQGSPGMGYTVLRGALEDAANDDPEHVFRTEVLCQWVEAMGEPWLHLPLWQSRGRDVSGLDELPSEWRLPDYRVVSVEVAARGEHAAVAAAGQTADGKWQVEVVASRRWTEWVLPYLQTLGPLVAGVVVHESGWGGDMARLLREAGMPVIPWVGQEYTAAHAAFIAAVRSGDLAHTSQPILETAVKTAQPRQVAGVDLIDYRGGALVTPLVACVGALWGAQRPKPAPRQIYTSPRRVKIA